MAPLSLPSADWHSTSKWTMMALVLAAVNAAFQATTSQYFFYTLFGWDIRPGLIAAFISLQALSYLVFAWAIYRYREAFTFRRPVVLFSYFLFILSTLLEMLVVLIHPSRHPFWHPTFPWSAGITGVSMVLLLWVWMPIKPDQEDPKPARVWIAFALAFIWVNALGFIYYPDIFSVFSFYPGVCDDGAFLSGVSGLEWLASLSLLFLWGWYAVMVTRHGRADYRRLVKGYLVCGMMMAISLILGIVHPIVHCLGVFLEINIDVCIQSTFVGSWAFLIGWPLLFSLLKVHRMISEGTMNQPERQSLGEEDHAVRETVSAARAASSAQVEAQSGPPVWQPPDTNGGPPTTPKRRCTKQCCGRWTYGCCFLLLPILVLLVIIFSMPFVTFDCDKALVPNVDISQSLEVCALELSRQPVSSLCLWATRDQKMTARELNISRDLYLDHYKDFAANDYFNRWHFSWAMNNIYELADPEHQPALESAWAVCQQEGKELGGVALTLTNGRASDGTLTCGFAHSLGYSFAHGHLVVPPPPDAESRLGGYPQAWLNDVQQYKTMNGFP